jgi:hypothetical protein
MCFNHTATLQGNLTFTNHNDLYIIFTQFSRRFWIWTWKFEIQLVAAHITILYYSLFWEKYNLHQSGCFIYHPDQNFVRGSEYPVRNLVHSNKYSYICIMCSPTQAHYREIWPSLIRMIYMSSWFESYGESESELRNFKFSLWQHIK